MVSVIIPSRGTLRFLGRALASVARQTAWREHIYEVVVGLDPGVRIPWLRAVNAPRANQAAAVNAAVAASRGDVLAFLEDDDEWAPDKLSLQLPLLGDLVTCVEGWGAHRYPFPGPSTWVMRREAWDAVGPMDEGFRWHLDADWLARAEGLNRVHLGAQLVTKHAHAASGLATIARHPAARAQSDAELARVRQCRT